MKRLAAGTGNGKPRTTASPRTWFSAWQSVVQVVAGGATLLAAPRPTPWGSLNSRLDAPGALQLTLFQEVEPEV